MTSSQDWGLARRIGFRFGVVFGALLIFPFPLNVLPKTETLTELLRQPLGWATHWFGEAVLGLPALASESNGSGDRTYDYVQLLLLAILGGIGVAAWSAFDRRRSHPQLAAAVRVALRYYVGYMMLSYGLSKVFRHQFTDMRPYALRTVLGDASPMGLLWDFMNYSAPYTIFGGLCEAVAGFLLLWRRTAAVGAVMVVAVMTNVVMLNFSYDVCVKLFSTRLLVMAALIALPDVRRLLAAALGRATPELPPRVRMPARHERARRIAKAALLVAMAVRLGLAVDRGRIKDRVHELYGNWVVDTFTADGVEHPLLTTDPARWQLMTAHITIVMIRLMPGGSDPPDPDHDYYAWKVDEASHTMTVTIDAAKKLDETWHYTHPTPDRLVIDGTHLGRSLHVALHAAPPSLLTTRGFHWINDVPFNR